MKWFKHMTDARFNKKLRAIKREFGFKGYGMWWVICEIVGGEFDGKTEPTTTASLKEWREIASI